ncbi:MAG: TonB-dependent receptor [Stagnimonas sp.]|nr:TonB-dependent receptor [Stagnimonas sp.]
MSHTAHNAAVGRRLATAFLGLMLVGFETAADETDDSIRLDPVTITAPAPAPAASLSGIETPARELPFTVSTVPVDELRSRGGSLSDVADYMPGVERSSDEGEGLFDEIAIRGFQSLFIAVNGLRRISILSETTSELANIERIEVLKGAAGAEQGIVGPGGAINYETLKPQYQQGARWLVNRAQQGLMRAEGDLTGPIGKGQDWAYRVVVSGLNGHDFRTQREQQRLFIAPSLQWRGERGTTVLVETEYDYADQPYDAGVFYLEAAGLKDNLAPSDFSYHVRGDNNRNYRSRVATYIKQSLGANLELRVAAELRHRRVDALYYSAFPTSLYENGFTPPYTFSGDSFLFGLRSTNRSPRNIGRIVQPELRGQFATGVLAHRWVLGYTLQKDKVQRIFRFTDQSMGFDVFDRDAERVNETFTGGLNDRIEQNIALSTQSLFAGYHLGIAEKLFLMANVRRDNSRIDERYFEFFADNTGIPLVDELGNLIPNPDPAAGGTEELSRYGEPKTSWRLGLLWQATPWLALHGSGSTGFFPQTGRLREGGNPPAQSNRSEEAGVRFGREDGRWQAAVTAFRVRQSNIAERDPNNTEDEFFIRIIGNVRARGVELSGNVSPLPDWNLLAFGTYTDSEITSNGEGNQGNRRYNIPRYSGGLRNRIGLGAIGLDALDWELALRRVEQRFGNDANDFSLPGYTRLDSGLGWEPSRALRLEAFVENLTNEGIYEESQNRVYSVTPGSPRTVWLTLRLER